MISVFHKAPLKTSIYITKKTLLNNTGDDGQAMSEKLMNVQMNR